MKRSHLITCLACAWAAGLNSQAQEATQETIDLEERRRSVANLEVHLKDRNQRLAELAEDIITLDERVEKRIDRIVTVLAESTDSGETGTKEGPAGVFDSANAAVAASILHCLLRCSLFLPRTGFTIQEFI